MAVPSLGLAPPVKRCWKPKQRGQPCTGRGTWGLDSWYLGSHLCATEYEQVARWDQVHVSQLQTPRSGSAPTAAAPWAETPNWGIP